MEKNNNKICMCAIASRKTQQKVKDITITTTKYR